jgi:enamine deaminase RidA (YjgF/YER057c/UK114 family)
MKRTVIGKTGTPYSQALKIEGGELFFISGQLAVDESGTLVGAGDLEAQARYIFSSMENLLAEAGGSLKHIVKIGAFITTMDGYASYGKVRRDVFGDTLPTSSTVIVAGLVVPGCVIEIEAIAVL